jgi:putative transposase
MSAASELSEVVGTARACDVLAVARASYYRWRDPTPGEITPRPSPPRALSAEERQVILETLNSEEFCVKAPPEVYATLLDRGVFLCSIRTMYRVLEANSQLRERRDQLRHPAYRKPELLATGPNQVWSWDITKLLGPAKWSYYCLYVILDIFSRYVVGWMVATRESATLARKLIEETVVKEQVDPDELVIHSDRGASMRSKSVALLLADLGITKSHSRPHVSDDNPFSEAQFKTLKYRPDFPDRFGSPEDARSFCRAFFQWYNMEHRHWGIALLTPGDVHHGRADATTQARQEVLNGAYYLHPERFVKGSPRARQLPEEVWINPPAPTPTQPAPATQSDRDAALPAPSGPDERRAPPPRDRSTTAESIPGPRRPARANSPPTRSRRTPTALH